MKIRYNLNEKYRYYYKKNNYIYIAVLTIAFYTREYGK